MICRVHAQRCGSSLGRRKVDLFRNIELLSSDEAVLLLICFDGFYEHLRLVEIPRLSLACKNKAPAADLYVAMEEASARRLFDISGGLAREMAMADSGSPFPRPRGGFP
ncbi:hypothetical protein NOJ05_20530 [Neorhizobium galegae]|uniref:hypothetical protein n=1 Tax=Neorhizobium galegae TaxID=399 RepID=UPI0021033D8C|nr:hypothetical protein [Neorhizobium galegae]MCQ1779601.1 hypothetical protein [Neorhizobium galegae]MCQ1798722.1 hypothetical protein [Neorhizobium galegae]